jgi:hypothetical protein
MPPNQLFRFAPTVTARETTPSTVTVNVPVPAPVVTESVASVEEIAVQVPAVTVVVPVTLFWTETDDPLVQLVSNPSNVSVTPGFPVFGRTRDGAMRVIVLGMGEVFATSAQFSHDCPKTDSFVSSCPSWSSIQN